MLQQYTRTSPKRSKIVIDDYQDAGGHGSIEIRCTTPCVFQGNFELQEITSQRTPVLLRDLKLRVSYRRSGGGGARCRNRAIGTFGGTHFGVECLGGNVNGAGNTKGRETYTRVIFAVGVGWVVGGVLVHATELRLICYMIN